MTLRQLHFVPPVLLLVAEAQGLLAREGVSLQARRTTSSAEQMAALMSGEADIAVTAMDNAFVWNEHGADVRIIGQVERSTGLSVYAAGERRSLADLHGARFAVDALSNGFAIIARWVLSEAGVTADFVQIGGVTERLDALLDGRVDATLLGPPFDAMADAAGVTRIASVDTVLPSYPGQGILVRAQRTPSEDEELRAYLRALTEAVSVADAMERGSGAELITQSGVPRGSAEALWESRPASLRVDPEGLKVLETLRSDLGLMPGGASGRLDLIQEVCLDLPNESSQTDAHKEMQ
ncbi:hypothetical protein BMW26_14535 [Microbacterium sp. 1.5R]|uniref:ABC transporter substrate-binding protein n=1 Tax=Microbacterium sp. 1.5R TaxID=1916917 RepID=UPI00090B8640|nr:ABC transporter substrate-binding protein [Microbacterium sp. 1.5R]APH46038.1 hypothetical protein BMW26_14535 [Microbacterium sp. 1.5R]